MDNTDKREESISDIGTMTVRERIVRISNELKISKEGRNTFSDYDYIRPDDLQDALKPLYLKYRIFAHFGMRKLKDGKNEAVLRIEDWNTDSGRQIYTLTVDDISIKGANSAQNVGGLRTYCNKYLLMTAFNISSDEDDLDNGKNTNGGDKKPKAENVKSGDEILASELIKLCQIKAKIEIEQEKLFFPVDFDSGDESFFCRNLCDYGQESGLCQFYADYLERMKIFEK
jgi:hypothetical protein